jgi:hypothetical protein
MSQGWIHEFLEERTALLAIRQTRQERAAIAEAHAGEMFGRLRDQVEHDDVDAAAGSRVLQGTACQGKVIVVDLLRKITHSNSAPPQ